jgi:glycine/D-amino acid oxidase-like deaminating enzyme
MRAYPGDKQKSGSGTIQCMEAASVQQRQLQELAELAALRAVEEQLPCGDCPDLQRAQRCASGALFQACSGSLECQSAIASLIQYLQAALHV